MRNTFPLLLAAVLISAAGCKQQEAEVPAPPMEVPVVTVTRRTIPQVLEFVGQTKGAIDAEVRARVDGVITGLYFEEGKSVIEGQLLYRIDPAPFLAKVAEAKGMLAQAQTELVRASTDVARLRPLAKMKAVSERQLDAAVAQEGAAKGALDAAKASLEAAEIELGYCDIKAPTSGIIGMSKAKIGEYVGKAPNPVVLNTISNLDEIHVKFGVDEKEYLEIARARRKKLESGSDAPAAQFELLLADGSKHPEPGTLNYADREVDPTTGTIAVEVRFPNPYQLIRPGQFAHVRVTLGQQTDALVVPQRALREIQGQHLAFVVKQDDTVQQKPVVIGSSFGELQVVEQGLSEGEVIVAEAAQRLKTGMHVARKRS